MNGESTEVGKLVEIVVDGESHKGRITEIDSHGRVKVEVWIWPHFIEEWKG